ncbi:multidrug effflux MFS transporter [Joostella atrarenae]|uniref:Multidrug effflux MFS transporter n=1 Tax=Joostella atrarenae TaxID=679257 RepID=A0ABS9J1G5_9FLAO|nr:multidrug effflux MFS transporter [Joostella atrarenae]MCF8714256.1 multidrug effflux MFS transporter [Joostella atrarenae]
MNKKNETLLILILGLITAIGPLSIDMYLPAFADIAKSLNTDVAKVSLSLSSFFAGLAIGQLMYGPLLERFGRRTPIFIGLIIYMIASIGCAYVDTIFGLILLRFFQAIGSCAGLVGGRAIVRDLYKTKEVARKFSMLMMVVAVSPVIAPTLGSFITTSFNWQFIFITLAGFALVLLGVAAVFLPESAAPNKSFSLKPKTVVRNYINILKDRQFLIFSFGGAIAYAGLYAYLSGSPHLYLEIFNLNEAQYGTVFAIIAAGLFSASQINNIILKKHSEMKIIYIALIAQCVVATLWALVTYFELSNLYITTFLIFSYLFCLGFIFPNASALSLERLGHTAGNASALMGAIQMLMGSVASSMVGIFQNETVFPMIIVMLFSALIASTILLRKKNHIIAAKLKFS